jgi:hypothetical protein
MRLKMAPEATLQSYWGSGRQSLQGRLDFEGIFCFTTVADLILP